MAITAIAPAQSPEGLDLASVRERLNAFLIDALILTFVCALFFAVALPFLGEPSNATPGRGIFILVCVCVVLEGCYDAGMTAWWGRSLGQMVVRSKVVQHDGSAVTGQQAWVRGFLKYVMVTTYLLAIVDGLMIFSRRRITLLDRITRTRVIRDA